MARILDGVALAADIRRELKQNIANWVELGHRVPSLRGVLVGDNPGSRTYAEFKMKVAEEVGIDMQVINLDYTISEEQLINKIKELNDDENIDGVMVYLPLPYTINERRVCNAVAPKKDVDGFHIMNVGKLCVDMPTIVPATVSAATEMLKRFNIETFGRNAVVVGRSKHIGMPIAMILHSDKRHDSGLGMDATVTICHRYTPQEQLAFYCRNADIIITSTGVPSLIKADMVKPGATVIDVGYMRVTDAKDKAKFVGDVDYDEVVKVAGAITPVPGGIGPVTVAMLMRNVFQVAKLLRG